MNGISLKQSLKRHVVSLLSLLLVFTINPLSGQSLMCPAATEIMSLSRKRILNPPSSPVPIEHTRERCTTLIPHILPSPDQQNAGSCLYMALTGIGEMALSILNSKESNFPSRVKLSHRIKLSEKVNLSERYTMNLGQKYLHQIPNWRTDMIDIFNINKGSCTNENYRYTMGWYFPDNTDATGPNGSPKPALAQAEGARKGTYYNWVTEPGFTSLPKISMPLFKRTVLFQTQDQSPFATGLHKRNMVEKVKNWLYTKNRPLLVIYNHFGYWHGVVITGFDDNRTSTGWFSEKFINYMEQRASFYDTYGETEKAAKYRKWVSDVVKNRDKTGGTSTGKGVFFVRDSIYPDPEGEKYNYVVNQTGEESALALPYIEHDYTWLMHLVNHIVAIDF